MIKIEKVQDRIWAKSPYSPGIETRFRKITGASWRKSDKVWTYPLDMVICRDLRREFGDNLVIQPQLAAWAREQVAKQKELAPLLTAVDAGVEDIELATLAERAPRIYKAMEDDNHRYQRPAALYMARARRCQNASQPGLGKTIETLAAIIMADVRGMILVAAPKTSVRVVWESEINRWLPGVPVFACTGPKQRRQSTLAQAQKAWGGGKHSLVFVIVNPEMLRTSSHEECNCGWHCVNGQLKKANEDAPQHMESIGDEKHKTVKWYEHEYPELFEWERGSGWSGFVIDETHRYILNVNLKTNRATQTGTGAMLVPLAADAVKYALSGTPWKGKPKNAWSVKHWLDGDVGLGASFWNWAGRFLSVEDNGYGAVVGDVRDDAVPEFNAWVDTFMIRHTKSEMAAWLPPKSYGGVPLDAADPASPIAVWLEMEGKQKSAYESMRDAASVRLDSGNLTATGVLAEMTRLKQFANGYGDLVDKVVKGGMLKQDDEAELVQRFVPKLPSNKLEWLLEFFDEHGMTEGEGESKVVVASQFTQWVNLISVELNRAGIDHLVLTGETSDKERARAVERFQQPGGPRVFLLNTMAGGVAVTLDAADDLVFLDETWVPDDQEQTEDRLHRTSRVHNVTIWYLKSRDSIDETIAVQNARADTIQKKLLDGKRGVQFAKKLLGGE